VRSTILTHAKRDLNSVTSATDGSFDGVKHKLDEFFVCVRHTDGALGSRDDSVCEDGDCYAADVVGDAVVASVNCGGDPCGVQQCKCASGADAHRNAVVIASRVDDAEDIVLDGLGDGHTLARVLCRDNIGAGANGCERLEGRGGAVDIHHCHFVVAVGVAECELHKESVGLRFGEGEGALRLDGVLRCNDEEGVGKLIGHAVNGRLTLAHALEKRGLGSRCGTVDLVGDKNICENGTRAEYEIRGLLVKVVDARDVGGEKVGGELNSFDITRDRFCKRACEGCLARAGNVVEQNVSARDKGDDDQLDLLALAEDDLADILGYIF